MAGLGLALVGGALKGFGEGQLASIKAMREEKLKQLDYLHEEGMQKTLLESQASEGEKNRASQEKLTAAQLAMNERLTRIQEEGATGRTVTTTEAQKDISKADIASRETIADKDIASREKISGNSTESQERIAKLQDDTTRKFEQARIDMQSALGVEKVVTKNGKTLLMFGNKVLPTPIDPTTGKEIDLATTDTDTQEMKNYKFMMSIPGIDPVKAQEVFSKVGTDPTVIKAGLVEAYIKSFGSKEEAPAWADEVYSRFKNATGGAAPASSADPGSTAPAAPAAAIVIPKGTPPETVKKWVTETLSHPNADRAGLLKAVTDGGYVPAEVGL